MKRLALISFAALGLAACTNNFPTNDPVEKQADLTRICIKEAKTPRLAAFVPSLVNSLKAKGITGEIYTDKVPETCPYMLTYAINARNDLVLRATVRVHKLDGSSYDEIGEVVYKQRSQDEQTASKSQGVQGQADRIVAELFKNY